MRFTSSIMVPDGSRRMTPSEASLLVRTGKTRLAYERACPQCKAKVGEICVATRTRGWETYKSVMDRPHNERYALARRVEGRRVKAEFTAKHLHYLERTAQDAARRSAAAKARWDLMAPMREFDRQEAQALRDWLMTYGDVFETPCQSA